MPHVWSLIWRRVECLQSSSPSSTLTSYVVVVVAFVLTDDRIYIDRWQGEDGAAKQTRTSVFFALILFDFRFIGFATHILFWILFLKYYFISFLSLYSLVYIQSESGARRVFKWLATVVAAARRVKSFSKLRLHSMVDPLVPPLFNLFFDSLSLYLYTLR